MQELDDHALLREYVDHGSEEAFATLVTRHVSKVYSVALRHTGNPHQAEEITQAVFVILARKSSQLGKRVILEGWLYQTARLTAITFIRSEVRRAHRENEAQMQTVLNENESAVWTQIAPLLDTAMDGLNETDRHAVVLRFFYGKSMKEVGAALGGSEGAARLRLHRAVEKLRQFFLKRGIASTTAIIAGAISANSLQAAPSLLAKTVTAIALANDGVAASSSTFTLVKGALKIMAWTKMKTAVAVGAAIILAVGTTTSIVVTKMAKSGNSSFKQKVLGFVAKPDGAVTADRTTPKGTMLVMANAMEAGDAKAYVESFVFTTSDESRLKSTLEGLIAAIARFNRASIDKFGAKAAHAVFPNLPFAIPTNMISSTEQKIQGDSATVSLSGKGGRPIQFTRIDGEWKMTAEGFVHLSPAVMNDLYARVIKALDETTPEIPQNKFKTAMEAVDMVKERAR